MIGLSSGSRVRRSDQARQEAQGPHALQQAQRALKLNTSWRRGGHTYPLAASRSTLAARFEQAEPGDIGCAHGVGRVEWDWMAVGLKALLTCRRAWLASQGRVYSLQR
jgi:hypothetical protein